MAVDDLSAPLKPAVSWLKRLSAGSIVNIVAGLLLAFGLGLLGWIVLENDPLGGEPVALIELRALQGDVPASAGASAEMRLSLDDTDNPNGESVAAANTSEFARDDALAGTADADSEDAGGVAVIRYASSRDGQPSSTSSSSAPEPGLLENGPYGKLPRIGSDGRRPSQTYARPAPAARGVGGANPARIAVVLTGLGISASATDTAIDRLPGEVSFAFAPYGRDVATQVAKARRDGHEVLLQVPMEPFDYPDNDPGPHTLLAGTSAAINLDNLKWLMARFPGYLGVTNYMGAKFTASEDAFAPIMREFAKRGLAYVDDGSSPRSAYAKLAEANGAYSSGADVMIDAGRTKETIDRALQRLETIAFERGYAVGVGTGLPLTIARLAEWTRSLRNKGIVLVPVSSTLKAPPQS